jgi:NMD protein affecting ribosome stability and mRNA decay
MNNKRGTLNLCGFCGDYEVSTPKVESRNIKEYGVCDKCKAVFVNGKWYINLAYAGKELGILSVKESLIN